MEATVFSHTGSIGDVIASIPAMSQYYRKYGKKIHLKLIEGVPAEYYNGASHPTRNSANEQVQLNERVCQMMIPLFKAQDFIEEVSIWEEGTDTGVELHAIRTTNVGMPSLCISRWYFYVFPNLACDLTKKWLTVPDAEKDFAKGKILITRTERYQNDRIDYSFLKPYEDDLLFCGTMREYNTFCMSFDLNVPLLRIENFLEFAQAIKQSKFHISNQTMAFQISTGLKHPRILEVCDFAPNVIVNGENAFDFLVQDGLEYYFHLLNGTEDEYLETARSKRTVN